MLDSTNPIAVQNPTIASRTGPPKDEWRRVCSVADVGVLKLIVVKSYLRQPDVEDRRDERSIAGTSGVAIRRIPPWCISEPE